MAIVKFGPTIVGARGTIAGTIFSANKGGPYARGWSKGANPQTAPQTAHRSLLGDIASTWRDRSDAEQDDWDDYADDPPQELTNSLGETYFASGFNWFIRINLNLEAAGAARRVLAPTLVRPVVPLTISGAFRISGAPSGTNVRFDVADPDLAELHTIFVRIYGSLGRKTASEKRLFLRIAIPTGARDIFVNDQIDDAYGTIALGMRGFFAARTQDSHGQRGPAVFMTRDSKV